MGGFLFWSKFKFFIIYMLLWKYIPFVFLSFDDSRDEQIKLFLSWSDWCLNIANVSIPRRWQISRVIIDFK
jgi:hypothetical protein